MDICQDIKDAKCCSLNMGAKWVNLAMYGDGYDEFFFNYLRLNAYIRTLERYKGESEKKKKLTLNNPEPLLCGTKKCLSNSEVCEIIEKVRLICSQCGCNC